LDIDGIGLQENLELKKRISSRYSNKAVDNNNVVKGSENLDQKRLSEPLPSHTSYMAKPSKCGKVLKTNLPN